MGAAKKDLFVRFRANAANQEKKSPGTSAPGLPEKGYAKG
jgi:hypothetical protein